jgi:hypothetical protein
LIKSGVENGKPVTVQTPSDGGLYHVKTWWHAVAVMTVELATPAVLAVGIPWWLRSKGLSLEVW